MSSITTDWKDPRSMAQDYTYKKINGGTCYQFYNLNKIKTNSTDTYAYQSYYSGGKWHAGTHKNRASPIVYAYNYGFNIPEKATIESVELQYVVMQRSYPSRKNLRTNILKLKTTSSVSDSGGSSYNYLKSSEQMWNVRTKGWSYFTRTIKASECHVTLTPSLVNSSNFGFIIQAIGTRSSNLGNTPAGGWDDAGISKMRIRVTYSNPEATKESTVQNATFKLSANIKGTDLQELSLNYPTKCTNLIITLEHLASNDYYYAGKTPALTLSSSDGQYKFSEKQTDTYIVQTQNVAGGTKPDNKENSVEVYPFLASDDGYIIISTDDTNVTPTRLEYKLKVNKWTGYNGGNTYDDTSNKFVGDQSLQGCIIKNNTFNGCSAQYGGGYYCSEEQEYITRSYTPEGSNTGSLVDGDGYAIHTDYDDERTVSVKIDSDEITGYYEDETLEFPHSNETYHVEDNRGADATKYFTLHSKWYNPNTCKYRFYLTYDFGDADTRAEYTSPFTCIYYMMTRYLRNVVAVGNNTHINMPRSEKSYQKGVLQDYDYKTGKYTYKEIDD